MVLTTVHKILHKKVTITAILRLVISQWRDAKCGENGDRAAAPVWIVSAHRCGAPGDPCPRPSLCLCPGE